MECKFLFYFTLLFLSRYCCADVDDNPITIRSWNPKYLTNCSASAARTSDHALVTNMTGTTLVPYNNNVSIAIILQMKSGRNFKLTYKICEVVQVKWMTDFMKKYTNLPHTCPFKPATYNFYNMHLPPKNMPIPIPERDFEVILQVFVTDSKEMIVDIVTKLHLEKKKKIEKIILE